MSSRSTPSSLGVTSPCSSAIVTVPMVPWPHIGRQPEVSMNRMRDIAIVARRRMRIEPDMMSWPRGSNIRPVRIQSNSARKCARFSIMVAAFNCGPPPATSRTGLPQV